jgi:hypothetical protein
MMGLIWCPETLVKNQNYSLRNIPDERSSHFTLPDDGLKKGIIYYNGMPHVKIYLTRYGIQLLVI